MTPVTRPRDTKGHFISTKSKKVAAKPRATASKTSSSPVPSSQGLAFSAPHPMSREMNKSIEYHPTKPKVHIYLDRADRWRWDLVAANGKIVADSGQSYATKWGCKRAARKFLGI